MSLVLILRSLEDRVSMSLPLTALLLLAGVPAPAADPAPFTIVLCAPGYPGTTKEAEPMMAALAAAIAQGAGLPKDSVRAVYEPTEKGGLARLEAPDVALAIVPYPFFLAHGATEKLEPRLRVELTTGATEVWSLVAKKGRVTGPASLERFTLQTTAGYAPEFVRSVLGAWGRIPDSARIVESSQTLSALKKAAAGQDIALLLDGSQSASLSSLPSAGDLEVVAQSAPQPVGFVSEVRGRLGRKRWSAIQKAVLELSSAPEGKAALASLRIARFLSQDDTALTGRR